MAGAAPARTLWDDEDPVFAPAPLRLVEDEPAAAISAAPRQTIRITGQPTPPRRRSSRTATHLQARPDRIVLWAFMLGLFMVFMAIATAHA